MHAHIGHIHGVVDSASVCPGNPDEKFICMVKAKRWVVKSTSGERTAAIDDAFQVSLNGEVYEQTIRTMDCSLFMEQSVNHAQIIGLI